MVRKIQFDTDSGALAESSPGTNISKGWYQEWGLVTRLAFCVQVASLPTVSHYQP